MFSEVPVKKWGDNMKIRNRKGFTLVEVIIVIAIIGVLASIAIPTMSSYYRKARITGAIADTRTVKTSIESSLINHIAVNHASSAGFNKVLYLDQDKGKNLKDRSYEVVGAFTNVSWYSYKKKENTNNGSAGLDKVIAGAMDNTFNEVWETGKKVNPLSYNQGVKTCNQYLTDAKTNFGIIVVYNRNGSVRMLQLYRNGVLVTYLNGEYLVNLEADAHFVGTGTWDTIYKDCGEGAPEEYCKVSLANGQLGNNGNMGGWY